MISGKHSNCSATSSIERNSRWQREQDAKAAAPASDAAPTGASGPALDAWEAKLDEREADLRRRELEIRQRELDQRELEHHERELDE